MRVDEEEFDPGRVLCSNGACTGVVAHDRCNLCGQPADGSPTPPPDTASASETVDRHLATVDSAFDPSFDEIDRKLCVDGACIGVLADDGKCKLCGRMGDVQVSS